MALNSENTSNRVYISSEEYGWLPAKVISTDDVSKKAVVEVKDYEDDFSIPACEVSSSINPTAAQKRRGNKTVPSKRIDIDMNEYGDGVFPLQNVDEDGKLIEVCDMVDLSFLHEVCSCFCIFFVFIGLVVYNKILDNTYSGHFLLLKGCYFIQSKSSSFTGYTLYTNW